MLTGVTIIVAVVIGVIQLLTLILNVASPTGRFWDGVEAAGNHYDIIGGAICGSFVFFGLLSVALYRPWRRRVDQHRERLRLVRRTYLAEEGDYREARPVRSEVQEGEGEIQVYDSAVIAETDQAGPTAASTSKNDRVYIERNHTSIELNKGL